MAVRSANRAINTGAQINPGRGEYLPSVFVVTVWVLLLRALAQQVHKMCVLLFRSLVSGCARLSGWPDNARRPERATR